MLQFLHLLWAGNKIVNYNNYFNDYVFVNFCTKYFYVYMYMYVWILDLIYFLLYLMNVILKLMRFYIYFFFNYLFDIFHLIYFELLYSQLQSILLKFIEVEEMKELPVLFLFQQVIINFRIWFITWFNRTTSTIYSIC